MAYLKLVNKRQSNRTYFDKTDEKEKVEKCIKNGTSIITYKKIREIKKLSPFC